MDAPPVQYVTTRDGYNLAYAVSGRGRPLVFVPPALHHIQLIRQWPSRCLLLEGLSSRFRLIQFDPRGQGLSSRGLPPTFSIADYGADLEAVIEHLRPERFVLVATCLFAHEALRYACRHPDRVEALVLFATATSNRAWPLSHLIGVGRDNWELLLWSRLPPGLSEQEAETRLAEVNQMITQTDLLTRWQACTDSDVSDILPHIRTPTFVLHPRNFVHLGSAEAIKLAAAIPNARLALIEGDDPRDLYGKPEAALAEIDDFMASLSALGKAADTGAAVSNRTGLSSRQAQVLRLIAAGKTTHEIAETLVLSERTVQRHIADVYAKIGARNRAEATAFAVTRLRA